MRLGIGCVLLLLASASPAVATLSVEVSPATIVLPTDGRPQTVIIVLRNLGKERVTSVRLTSLPAPEIEVSATQPIATLGPGSDATWILNLSTKEAPANGRVTLRIEYVADGGGTALPKIAVASIDVKTLERAPIDEVASVDVQTTLESLDQQHPGWVYLQVSNKWNREITVRPLKPYAPDFINFPEVAGVKLDPREVQVIPVRVTAADTVQPGTHMIVFPVDVRWTVAGRPERTTIVATRVVTVGIFGESEVLKLLGVPIFALLPGFLALVTITALWQNRIFRAASADEKFVVTPTTPQFWIVAITLSGLIAFAYYAYTGRDYLTVYGLRDVITVWLVSIFIFGAGLYLAIAAALKAWAWWWTPRENEDAVNALRKLGRRGVGVQLEQVATADNRRALLMEPLRSDRLTVWVTSRIVVEWKNDTSPLKPLIEHELEPDGRPSRLATLLEQGTRGKQLEYKWQDGGPRELAIASIKNRFVALPIIDFV